MLEIRVRTKASKEYLDSVIGKILGKADVDVMLTGQVRVLKPDGSPLCIYLPKAIPKELNEEAYKILHTIKGTTTNRGLASGGGRATPKHIGPIDPERGRYRSYGIPVMSSIIGSMEATGAPEHQFCRITAWTGQHVPEWRALQPYFQCIAQHFAEQVPNRYAAQMKRVAETKQEWIIPGTPFTTVTVNISYNTGVHQDKGDLGEGFSCLAVQRRGRYTGCYLTFPEYRTAVNMQDGDLILMDAHEWHGNVELKKLSEDAERISTVCYFRTEFVKCGTPEEELQKATIRKE